MEIGVDWICVCSSPQTGEFVPADAEDYEGDELNDLSDTGDPFHIRSHTEECNADTHNAGVLFPLSESEADTQPLATNGNYPIPKYLRRQLESHRRSRCVAGCAGAQAGNTSEILTYTALPTNPTEPRYSKCQP